jgi:hypothetical protein
LSLIIALSAYLATVRHRYIDSIKEAKRDCSLAPRDPDKKARLDRLSGELFSISIADILLVASGMLLGGFAGIRKFFGFSFAWLENLGIILFSVSLACLAYFHLRQIHKSWKERSE